MDLACVMPSSVQMVYVFDDLLNPRNMPSNHLVPMLPSGLARGPLLGNLYRAVSPKPSRSWLNFRPLIRSQDVRPSEPRLFAFRRMHV